MQITHSMYKSKKFYNIQIITPIKERQKMLYSSVMSLETLFIPLYLLSQFEKTFQICQIMLKSQMRNKPAYKYFFYIYILPDNFKASAWTLMSLYHIQLMYFDLTLVQNIIAKFCLKVRTNSMVIIFKVRKLYQPNWPCIKASIRLIA